MILTCTVNNAKYHVQVQHISTYADMLDFVDRSADMTLVEQCQEIAAHTVVSDAVYDPDLDSFQDRPLGHMPPEVASRIVQDVRQEIEQVFLLAASAPDTRPPAA